MSTTYIQIDPTPGGHRRRVIRGRSRRLIASAAVIGVVASGGLLAAPSAGATSLPNSQSVGRFLDGALGGTTPIQQVVDVKDARATNPGTVTTQNPLDVKVLQAIDLPLTGALQLPEIAGIHLGAVNQVAVAKADGYSYGASGAVANSGGVSIGGNNNAFPANATIDLDASALGGGSVPVPGGGSAAALGGVKLSIGAVAALAQTPAGVGQPGSASYGIASLDLQAGSPLLAGVLSNVTGPIANLITTLSNGAQALGLALPADCPLTKGQLPDLSLEQGAITIDSQTGTLTLSLDRLLDVLLGSSNNLNHLAPNTDLIKLLLNYLTSPTGLAAGISAAINGLVGDLRTSLKSCTPPAIAALVDPLFQAGSTLQNAISGVLTQLGQSAGGSSPLAPLATGLTQLVDIGVNVQPHGPSGTFSSKLKATPNQATPVVDGQTVVRAIEIDIVGTGVDLALANAAAGPSNPVVASPSSVPPTHTAEAASNLPTGVPAGYVKPAGTPTTPIVLLAVGLLLATGGGVAAWRMRGTHAR